MGKHKKSHGRYCWVCGCRRPNEAFSGRGWRRCVCKRCSQLGKEELARRSANRDVDQCFTWEGYPRRKRRSQLDRALHSEDPQVRDYARKRLVEAVGPHAAARVLEAGAPQGAAVSAPADPVRT